MILQTERVVHRAPLPWPVLLVGALLLMAVVPARAQRAELRPSTAFDGSEVIHESWTVSDGLPVNSINDLIQSTDGYIWAATFDGLVRFDGIKFTIFNSANSPGLPSNRLIRLQEGENGVLWLWAESGELVRRERGRFTVVAAPGCGSSRGVVPALLSGATNWLGSCRGLARVDGDSLVPVRPDLIRDTVQTLLRRRDGTLLVGTATQGLLRLRDRGGVVDPIREPADSVLAQLAVFALYEASDGVLWAATDAGIWSFRNGWRRAPLADGTELVQALSIEADPGGDGVVLYGYRTRDGASLSDAINVATVARSDGNVTTAVDSGPPSYGVRPLWVSGASVWHGMRSTLYRDGQPVLRLDADGRPSGAMTITSGFADHEGSLWLGTLAGGLHRLKPTRVRTISEPEGLRAANVYGTYVDRLGAVWAGSVGYGYSRIDPVTGRIEGFGSRSQPPWEARTFFEDRTGTFWIGGTYGQNSLHRCESTTSLRCTQELAAGRALPPVFALYEDLEGRLWIGAQGSLYQRDRERVVRLDPAAGAPTKTVRAFAATRDGALWMGTNGGGLVRYREGVFTSVTTADGLPSDLVRALHVDPDGWLWVGTEGRGLARLDPRGWDQRDGSVERRRIATISTRQGLFDNGVHEILADDDDRLWMSSNRGIFWLARREALGVADGRLPRVHSTGYTDRDGMRNPEANGGVQPSGAKGPDGRLWFATQDGVVVIDPRVVAIDTVPPLLAVEQVVAGDSTFLASSGAVRLSPRQRDIRVDFTALTFLEPRNVRFRYRLDGYDAEWVDSDQRRSAFYTKLPPGRYAFLLQAAKPGQEWGDINARLDIHVVPRFYEMAAFRIGLLLGITLLLAGAVVRRSRAGRRRARELEQLVAERTLALRDREHRLEVQNSQLEVQAAELRQLDEARTRFFTNVSHELRTPLTLMIAPLDRLREQPSVAGQGQLWLDLAQRNARRLLELVNQMLDVAKLEAGAVRLDPRRLELSALLRGAMESFRLPAERKQLRLMVDVPAAYHVMLDRDAVEKIVSNLLSNAVKFTPPHGEVMLTLRHEQAGIVISVANTGPAIPESQLALVFERFYQVDESHTSRQPGTGIGLSLVKELVELQGGRVTVFSDARATTFTVTLPLADGASAPPLSGLNEDHAGPVPVDPASQRDDREVDVPTLLVVDDSDDMRLFIRGHFADRFRILEAADGQEALEVARAQRPDVIVSDVMMPKLDGRELVRRLRASPETDYLSIILLTAQAENEQRITGLEGGADDYLGKPFEMRELDVRVCNLIAARRRLQLHYAKPASSPGEPLAADREPAFTLPGDTDALSADDVAYRDRVLAAIRERLSDEDFGVAELADAMAQDRSHLFRRVRQVTGLSPSDLLRRLRIEEGARLLLATPGSVADVAFSVGFRSVSHFFRCFNERYGVTPSEYRASGAEVAVQEGGGQR